MKDLSLKDKIKYYITHKKKQTGVIVGSILIVLCIVGVAIMKLSNSEVIACAKSRSSILEGETITDLIYNSSKEIKILNDNNVKATFFMINPNMQAYPQQVKNIVSNGNTAGFHSVSHDIHKLYATDNSAKEEFDINQKTFKEITGQTSKIIRLPFGSKPYTSRASYNAIVNAGYKLWDWTLDTEDWKSTSPQIVETIKKHTHDTDNIVLLIHERKQTVAVLDEIIKYFKKEGFEILPIKQSDEERNYWNGKLFS